jgi:hypothetical protein
MRLNLQYFASGTIDGSSTTSNCDCRVVWSSSKNDSSNTSTVTATVQIYKSGSSSTKGTFSGSITIDGSSYSVSKYGSWSWGNWHTVGSASKTVTHNANGTKSINISASLKQTGTSMAGTYSASGSATLDTINRASKLGTISNFNLTDTITIPITKYSSSFTDSLVIKLGSTVLKTINDITNGYSLTFTTEEQNTILGLMTSPQAVLTFVLTTKNGSSTLGTSTKTATITSLDKPIFRNVVKKENGHYQVAINGTVNTSIKDVLQVYDDNGNLINNNQILWEGAWYMNGSQTATLSQKISEQQHGIVLVWQAYDNGSAQPWHYNFCFVPKWQALTNPSRGVSMWLTNDVGSQVASKYIYVYDNKLVGHNNNGSGETSRGSGINVTNNHWVLTCVLGV